MLLPAKDSFLQHHYNDNESYLNFTKIQLGIVGIYTCCCLPKTVFCNITTMIRRATKTRDPITRSATAQVGTTSAEVVSVVAVGSVVAESTVAKSAESAMAEEGQAVGLAEVSSQWP